LPRKPHKRPRAEPAGSKGTAKKMADAVSYLCRVAAEEGFHAVLPDLLEVQQKLENIASPQNASSKRFN
jgi:dienelactone hydrolase